MSNVYICSAETLTLPAAGDVNADFNAFRWNQVLQFITFELLALFNTRFVTNLAYDPTSSVSSFMSGLWGSVIPVSPNAISHPNVVVTTVAPASAITVFGANLIYDLSGGGKSPNAIQAAAVATLKAQALAVGVPWRDASNIGPVPAALLPAPVAGISGVPPAPS